MARRTMRLKKQEQFKPQEKEVIKNTIEIVQSNLEKSNDILAGPLENYKDLIRISNRYLDEQDWDLLKPVINKIKREDPWYKSTSKKDLYLKYWAVKQIAFLPEKINYNEMDPSSNLQRFLSRRFS